jgi:hypothetical protein
MSFIFDFDETITTTETTSLLEQISSRASPTKKERWDRRVQEYYDGYKLVYNRILQSTEQLQGNQSENDDQIAKKNFSKSIPTPSC